MQMQDVTADKWYSQHVMDYRHPAQHVLTHSNSRSAASTALAL